mmetsp:Transcript_27578/g.31617  ORF Transcript_27578/g.31617 Transcript_27578/m.31617 type:complete len:86 (-) Transcript_27578:63-320(-)
MYWEYPSFSSLTINGNQDNGSFGLQFPCRRTRSTCCFSELGIVGGDGRNNNNEDKDADDANGDDEIEDADDGNDGNINHNDNATQ